MVATKNKNLSKERGGTHLYPGASSHCHPQRGVVRFLCFCWAAALVRVLGLTRCLLAWSHYHLRGVGHGGSIIKCWTNLTTAFGKQLQFFSNVLNKAFGILWGRCPLERHHLRHMYSQPWGRLKPAIRAVAMAPETVANQQIFYSDFHDGKECVNERRLLRILAPNAAPVGAGAAKSDSSNNENQLLYGRLTNTQYTQVSSGNSHRAQRCSKSCNHSSKRQNKDR